MVKGAPEQVMARCQEIPDKPQRTLAALFADGRRVVARASRPAPEHATLCASDEAGLTLEGFLVFADNPKSDARDSLARLAVLGIEVKVATGDSARVAEKVCSDVGLLSKGTITGAELDQMNDDEFASAARDRTIFARISPEQKARVISSLRNPKDRSAFSATGSTMRWPCTPPMSAFPLTPPPTSPRTRPMSCCWRRTSASWLRESPRAGASLPTPSNTC